MMKLIISLILLAVVITAFAITFTSHIGTCHRINDLWSSEYERCSSVHGSYFCDRINDFNSKCSWVDILKGNML